MTSSARLEISKATLHNSIDIKQLGLILAILFSGVSLLVASSLEVQAKTHQGVILGGVNLTPWCKKQYGNGFKAKLIGNTAGGWTCERSAGDRRPILVDKACILQYGAKAVKAKALNRNDPYSWKCLGKPAGPTTASTGTSTGICEPGPRQVAFFQHTNYKGVCSVLPVGKYENSKAMRMRNDTISSIKVGRQVNVTVCVHATDKFFTSSLFQGCQTFKNSIRSFKNQRIGNDSISSALIFKPIIGYNPAKGRCKPSDGQEAVAVYQDANYKGFCRLLNLGDYRNSKEMNFKNDSISSIEFGRNSKAYITVCNNSNLQGRCENITASLSSLHNSQVGDNQITSIRVRRR